MAMLAKIRRMYFRDKLSIREIARRTHLSRNTVSDWLSKPEMVEPKYPPRHNFRLVQPYSAQLQQWLETDSHRPKRDRRTSKALFEAIKAQGYPGSYIRAAVHIRELRIALQDAPQRKAFVPLHFEHGEAFQFDWSREYAWIGGLRRALEVSHLKLPCSRAFFVIAYPTQSHEMLFDAHTRSFQALGGIPRRGIYDNMKTAVDKVKKGKERIVNARFQAMCGHYLFEPDFCNVASGWEKGVVEKNVQDRRRQIWAEAMDQRWESLEQLNNWLALRCKQAWETMSHPEWPAMTIAEVLQDERLQMMPVPKAFDGYVAHPARVSATSLIHFQRNRYSVPTPYAHRVVSVHVYPDYLAIIVDDEEIARHTRSFDRYQTFYQWQHYIPIITQKPGALRNGAPFLHMPQPLQDLQRQLLKHTGGDRVMAELLATIPVYGLDAVLVAVECALETGHASAEHVLNLVARLKEPAIKPETIATKLKLQEEPKANVQRYERLRQTNLEDNNVA